MSVSQILVVDDDSATLGAMGRVLGNAGYEVTTAASGDQAIRKLKQAPVDLVITDMVMPFGDGVDVIKAVRRDFPQVPVLAVSGGSKQLGAEVYLLIARGFGVKGVLQKPVSREELIAAVKGVEAGSAD